MDDTLKRKHEKPNIEGDRVNILIMFFLYALQGGTSGLSSAFPIILLNRKASYAEQAVYSITGYPFNFKLLWAPIVDSMYSRRIGRRKTWLVPMQYLIGDVWKSYHIIFIAGGEHQGHSPVTAYELIKEHKSPPHNSSTVNYDELSEQSAPEPITPFGLFFPLAFLTHSFWTSALYVGFVQLFISMCLDGWLGGEDGAQRPRIKLLTFMFFLTVLFNAIQDVALDSWSLTMLQRRNIGYAGLCQNLGSSFGSLSTYTLLILLDSKEFCNKFRTVPQDRGFVNLADFIFYWSILLIVTTTLVFLFKKESSSADTADDRGDPELSIKESYVYLWKIIKLRPVITLCLVLITCRAGFGPLNGVAPLKVIQAGVTGENYVLLTVSVLPLQMILSIVFRRWLSGPRPMHAFVVTYILKLATGTLVAIALFFSTYVKGEGEMLPIWFRCVLLFVFNLRNILKYFMALSLGTLFCRISDARYGGTYMTLWGSLVNIGANWATTTSLWFVDLLTIKNCDKKTGICSTKFDGFYAEVIVCTILGALWLFWGKKTVLQLDKVDAASWIVEEKKNTVIENDEKLPLS